MKNLLLFVILVAFFMVPDALISKKYTRKQDSLELIKFYDATDGDNWLINTGWKDRKLPVWQWHGVGIDWIVKNLDTMVIVIEIELEQNDLKGNLPELNLPDLFGIFVAKNKLFGTIPTYANTPLSWMDVSNNLFLFEDFSKNKTYLLGLEVFVYENQDTVFQLIIHKNGNKLTAENPYKYSGNYYKWYIDGKLYNETKDSILIIEPLSAIRCEVYNSNIPTLFYKSNSYQIQTELVSPLNKATNVASPELKWKYIDVAEKYAIKTTIEFSGGKISRIDTTTNTYFKIPAEFAKYNSKYTWSVAPMNNSFIGKYTDIWEFSTETVDEYTDVNDSLQLVEFFKSSDGYKWNDYTNWLTSNPVWTWSGIKTIPVNENGRLIHKVETIYLSFRNVKFTNLNLSLPYLKTIKLENNNTNYSMDLDKMNLPALKTLNLRGNTFNDEISKFNKLEKLETLDLENNGLKSLNGLNLNYLKYLKVNMAPENNINFDISLPELTYLYINYSSMAGKITNLKLPKLKFLSLINNAITGFENCEFPVIESVDLTSNNLSDVSELKSFKYATTLNISSNKFKGELVGFDFPKLLNLSAWTNQFNGRIDLSVMPNLTSLSLSGNKFDTIIMEPHSNLKYLRLEGNQIKGSLPILNLPNLIDLNLTGNKIEKFSKMNTPKLKNLYLSNNIISDSVPYFKSLYPEITAVYLSSNKLTFEHLALNHFNNKQIKYSYENQQVTYDVKVTQEGIEYFLEPVYEGIADNFEWLTYPDITLSSGKYFNIKKPVNTIRCKMSFSKIAGLSYYTNYFFPGPKKIYPADRDTAIQLSPEFRWTKVDYADKYWLMVSESPSFYSSFVVETKDTVAKLMQPLDPNKKYYWSVRFYVGITYSANLVSSFNTISAEVTANTKDSIALVEIYNKLDGKNWKYNSNWLTNQPINKWYGVSAKTVKIGDIYKYFVIGIDLSNNLLKGEIDKIELDSLFSLQFSTNAISGQIPQIISKNIQSITLSKNQFSSGTAKLFNNTLTSLDLSDNIIDEEIEEITGDKLSFIALKSNKFKGYVPALNAPNLKYAILGLNDFTDVSSVISHDSLRTIDLSYCKLSGNLPEFNVPAIEKIILNNNAFEGNLFELNYKNLSEININANKISGKIPEMNLSYLKFFYANNNKLTGNLPKNNSSYLTVFDISKNKFVFEDFHENSVDYYPIQTFYYYPQDTIIEFKLEKTGILYQLSPMIKDEITNSYKWYKDSQMISDTTYSISGTNIYSKYQCYITNYFYGKLTLQTNNSSVEELTTSVEIEKNNTNIEIFPNPAMNSISLLNFNYEDTFLNYQISDINGKVVLIGELTSVSKLIEISSLANGVYFVNIDKIGTFKFVKI